MSCNICHKLDDCMKVNECDRIKYIYGTIITEEDICCPECNSPNVYNNLPISNNEILEVLKEDPEWFYIICPSCIELNRYAKKSDNYQDTGLRLLCVDCSSQIYKECPGCSVMIEKNGGCSHIECKNCMTNFCWICSEICDENSIEDHLIKIHVNDDMTAYRRYLILFECDYIEDIKMIPREFWTEELINLAFEFNPNTIMYLKDISRFNEELYFRAVKSDGLALEYIDELEKKSDELLIEAVKSNGLALQFIKNERQNYEICLQAVCSNGIALQYVNPPYQNKELCLRAVENTGLALRYVNLEYIDYEICEMAVENTGLALEFVPHIYRTESLYLKAVKNDPWSLQFIPYNYQTKELCLIAVKNDGMAIFCVTSDLQYDYDILFTAAKNNNNLFKMIYKQLLCIFLITGFILIAMYFLFRGIMNLIW